MNTDINKWSLTQNSLAVSTSKKPIYLRSGNKSGCANKSTSRFYKRNSSLNNQI